MTAPRNVTLPEEAAELLEALWAPLEAPGFVEWRPRYPDRLPPGDPRHAVHRAAWRWLRLDDALARLPAYLEWCAREGLSAYFGALPRQVFRDGTKDSVTVGAAAWVDIDRPAHLAREAVRGLLFPPSALVLTGRGLHGYWLLTEPVDAAVCERLSKQLTRLVDGCLVPPIRPRLIPLKKSRLQPETSSGSVSQP